MDFSKQLIRCSAIGLIMTEPKGCITEKQLETLKKLEEKGNLTEKQREEYLTLVAKRAEAEYLPLSDTAQGHLLEVFVYKMWGKRIKPALDNNKYLMKGKLVENDSIALVSFLDEKLYEKNDERLSNEWLTGEPDLFDGELLIKADKVIDVKSSWDLSTYWDAVLDGLKKVWWWQMQGYLALTNCQAGEIHICLVSTPEVLVNDEKRRLFHKMDCVTEEDPAYKAAAANLEFNMRFDDIPPDQRRFIYTVERDDAAIEQIYRRVVKCREWLQSYQSTYEVAFRKNQ